MRQTIAAYDFARVLDRSRDRLHVLFDQRLARGLGVSGGGWLHQFGVRAGERVGGQCAAGGQRQQCGEQPEQERRLAPAGQSTADSKRARDRARGAIGRHIGPLYPWSGGGLSGPGATQRLVSTRFCGWIISELAQRPPWPNH